MQAMELLQLAKGTSPDEASLNSEEIKPVAIEPLSSYACLNPSVNCNIPGEMYLAIGAKRKVREISNVNYQLATNS